MAWITMDNNGRIFIYANKPIQIEGTWIPLDVKFAELKDPSDSVFLLGKYITPQSTPIYV